LGLTPQASMRAPVVKSLGVFFSNTTSSNISCRDLAACPGARCLKALPASFYSCRPRRPVTRCLMRYAARSDKPV
jgi:hypothetical protein